MNICIPVEEDKGMDSRVCAHFGSAPLFLIVDTDSGSTKAVQNINTGHAHGMCQPLASLEGEDVDGMVVGGIGMGALNKLSAAGVSVYLSEFQTVKETMDAFKAGTLNPVTPGTACRHHGSGGGGHGQGSGGCGHKP